MGALIAVGAIVLIFFLIGMIKIGVSFNFIDQRLSVGLLVLGQTIQIKKNDKDESSQDKPPEEPKKEKPKKPKKEKEKKEKEIPLSITVDDVTDFLNSVGSSLGSLFKGFNFDRFLLHLTVATDDPYNTAVAFGNVNQIINVLAPLCAVRYDCRDLDVWTAVNFNEVLPRIDLGFDLTIRLHSITRRVDILFAGLELLAKSFVRYEKQKIFHHEEYLYEQELSRQRKEQLKSILSAVKKNPDTGSEENGSGEISQDVNSNINTNADSDTDERMNS